ncbi:MAG: type 1 glutamine amidotransferase [Chthoniobacterales bacterium]|nr:type 1 glutamine amidotransferase [Chthoniobacterales bacterium]
MEPKFYIFQHSENEGPGTVVEIFGEHGVKWEVVRCWELKGEEGERFEDATGVLILGGGMNVYQYRDYPWLLEEKAILRGLLGRGVVAIGICLGAQLLTDLCGGKVVQNPVYELGWWPVEFTGIARKIFPGLTKEITTFHWHGDRCILPQSAVVLARNKNCPVQAFLLNERILGIQFHPEMNRRLIEDFLSGDPNSLPCGPFVQSVEEIRGKAEEYLPVGREVLETLLGTFLKLNLDIERK